MVRKTQNFVFTRFYLTAYASGPTSHRQHKVFHFSTVHLVKLSVSVFHFTFIYLNGLVVCLKSQNFSTSSLCLHYQFHRFKGGDNIRENSWECADPKEKCEWKGTKEHLERGRVGVGLLVGEEQRCMYGGTEGKLERGKWRSDGAWGVGMWRVMPRSDPISVRWLTEGVQREVSWTPPYRHTRNIRADLDRKPTDRWTKICETLTKTNFLWVLLQPPAPNMLPPTPPGFASLDLPSRSKSPHWIHLHTDCSYATQTSGAPPAGSWPGEGQESPGSGFMWRLLVRAWTRFLLSVVAVSLFSAFCAVWRV